MYFLAYKILHLRTFLVQAQVLQVMVLQSGLSSYWVLVVVALVRIAC